MNQDQRANTFMQANESLFDDQDLDTEVIEALDLSKIKGRYAGLPASLKVPATVGHVLVFAGLIIEELEKVMAEIKRIKAAPKVVRQGPPKDRLYSRM